MDKGTTWCGSRPRPRSHCIRRGPSSPQKRHSSPPPFWPMSIVATVAHLSYCWAVVQMVAQKMNTKWAHYIYVEKCTYKEQLDVHIDISYLCSIHSWHLLFFPGHSVSTMLYPSKSLMSIGISASPCLDQLSFAEWNLAKAPDSIYQSH